MRTLPIAIASMALTCYSVTASAQLSIRTGEGESVTLDLGYGITLNQGSSLKRQWVYIHDPKSPVDIQGDSAVGLRFDKDYQFFSNYTIKANKDVSAVEVIHVIVDAFGRRTGTLQGVTVMDMAAGTESRISGRWRAWSETDAKAALTSFTYVRSARYADGAIYNAPTSQILEVIRKGAPSMAVSDIEPKKSDN